MTLSLAAPHSNPPGAAFAAGEIPGGISSSNESASAGARCGRDIPSMTAHASTWHNIGDVAEKGLLTVWDAANRVKDRQDEALDAMRVSNGMTLDQYLESAR